MSRIPISPKLETSSDSDLIRIIKELSEDAHPDRHEVNFFEWMASGSPNRLSFNGAMLSDPWTIVLQWTLGGAAGISGPVEVSNGFRSVQT